MKNIKALLISRKIVAPDVHHLYFYAGDGGFAYEPGQYVILTIPGAPSPVKRLYSFAGADNGDGIFELLVKFVPGGLASEYLKSLPLGSCIEASGPAGLFSQQKTSSKKIYMATGTGFAPIRSFLLSNSSNPGDSSLFWGLKDLSETYLLDELLSLNKLSPSFSFSYCLSQQPSLESIPADLQQYFRMGHIDVVWASLNPIINPLDEYYLCGSRVVIESLRLLLLSKGVSKNNLFFEKY